MRAGFDHELRELQDKLLIMGSKVEETIILAVSSLAGQDLDLARKIIDGDDIIDALSDEIEETCLRIIARQQPIAGDLRVLTTAMKMVTDLERIADHATNIAEITQRIGRQKLIKPLIDIPRMARLVEDMVHTSLQAFVERDVDKAKNNCLRDNEVDQIYENIFLEIMAMIQKGMSPDDIVQAINLLFAARYLERVGDHATNIGERVIFLVTGKRESY